MFLKEEERTVCFGWFFRDVRKKQDLEYVECGMRSGVAVNHMSKRQRDGIDLIMINKRKLIQHRLTVIFGFDVS